MSDNNRFELDIIANDDTGPATAKVRANFNSMEQQAAKTAASMNKGFDAASIGISQQIEKATGGVLRSIQSLERSAALVGKTGMERIETQKRILIGRAGSDEAAIQRIVVAMRRLSDEQERLDRKAATRTAGIFAGKATLAGESDFQSALKAVQSRDAELKFLEDRAKRVTLSKPDFLRNELGGILAQRGITNSSAQRYRTAYADLIKAAEEEEKHSGGHGGTGSMVARRGFLAVKDFGEGRTSGTTAEIADILFGQGGTGGVVQKVIPQIAEITGVSSTAVIAVGALSAAFLGLGVAGLVSVRHLAETGEQIKNYSLRTGIDPTRVQAFQFAAKASGVDPDIFERMTRGLSQATNDDSPSGNKARKELQSLGVNLHDELGDLKPTEQIIIELAQAINKLPPGLQQSAASMEIFKRIGVEAVPVLKDLRENLSKSDQIGNTFTESDLKMFEEWKKQIVVMDAEWQRFKAEIMKPLAVAATVTLHVVNEAVSGKEGSARAYGSPYASVLEPGINDALAAQGLFADPNIPRPKPPGVPAGLSPYDVALQKRKDIDASIRAMTAEREKDPRFRLQEAEKALAALPVPELGVTKDPKVVNDYREALKRVEALKSSSGSGSNTALEGVIAARKQGFELDAKYAEIQASAEQKRLSASLDTHKELMSPEDINTRLKLAELTAIAQKDKEVEARRKTIDTKTGEEVDLSGTVGFQKFQAAEEKTLPKRIRNEYATVLGELEAQDARYFKARNDADGKAWEEAWQRRKKGELDLQQEEINTRQQIQTRQFDIDGQAIDRQKEMALQGLGLIDAQTLKDKIALEDQKLAIEDAYAERSLANQIAKLQNQEAIAVAEIQKKAAESGNSGSDAEAADIASRQAEYQQQIDAARAATSDKEKLDNQKTINTKEKLAIESNKRVYDSLKQDASGLFDQLVSHTKSWADFAKDLFKSAILTPVKDIFSSQVAGLFTGLLTGQKVSFGEVGNGQGTFGKLGSIFGRAGLGQPKFGDANHPLAKLNAPNHLGDVSLVSGAVPVVLMNAQQGQQTKNVTNHLSFAAAAGGAGFLDLIRAGGARASSMSSSSDAFSTDSTLITDPSQFGGPGASGGTFGSFSDISKLVGSPGGTSGFAGPVNGGDGSAGSAGATSSGGGIFASLGHSLMGGIGKLFGRGDGSAGSDTGETDGETGLPLGHGIPGSEDNSSGETDGASKGVGGPMGALLVAGGTMLAMDGWKRRGPVGMVEMGAGGAAIGFKYGGPLGGIIGGGIGLLAGGLHWAFGGGDQKHAKDLVKQIYGMDINNATADQIVQIAKQSFGNQIDVAVRSPQVRELLKLYSQATGQKKAEDQFVQDTVHSASFTESGGKLFQNAVYDNGNAYSYSSPLSTYGGVTTAPLSTYAPNQGVFSGSIQLNVDGQSAADLLEGRITNTVTPGFVQGQALAASSSSIGRTSQQNMALSPSALTR